MKFIYSFLFGLIVGGGIVYFLLNKYTPTEATMLITASDSKAIISNETLEVNTKRNIVETIAAFETDRRDIYTNTITINRRDLQYKHSVYGETGYWINTQMPFFSLAYSYEWLLISAKVGYSFRQQEVDYGIGIGMKYSF